MSASETERAREALRLRQGLGARYDADAAPARMLMIARRGTSYFARRLNALSDADLGRPGLLGRARSVEVAFIGYQARGLARLAEWARTGIEQPMYLAPQALAADVADGATLPRHALRHLFAHAAVHLNVEWRDLHDAAWDAPLKDPSGRAITARDTVFMRARAIWRGALALDNGGRIEDVPVPLLHALAQDMSRRSRDCALEQHLIAHGAWLLGLAREQPAGLPELPDYF